MKKAPNKVWTEYNEESTEHNEKSTEHNEKSAEYNEESTEHNEKSTKYNEGSTEYLTIIRRRRSESRRIFPETKSRGIFAVIHWAWGE